jgi:GNAT superfamily N-acetyltransferase
MQTERDVTTYYLELLSRDQLSPPRHMQNDFQLVRAELPCPELNRFLYTAVGGSWYWTDRLGWSYKDWLSYLDRPELETWVAYLRGTPLGYFELEMQAGGNVEIAYFGLLHNSQGRGLGAALLTRAVERAWNMGAKRVWVHTCSLDHPGALRNYLSRGFREFKRTTTRQVEPAHPVGPWPGAHPVPE